MVVEARPTLAVFHRHLSIATAVKPGARLRAFMNGETLRRLGGELAQGGYDVASDIAQTCNRAATGSGPTGVVFLNVELWVDAQMNNGDMRFQQAS
jgi:hypothetical protein